MEEITYEERFKNTLLEYLSVKNELELQQMLSQCKIVLQLSGDYSGKQWNQRSARIEIKVPVTYREIIEKEYLPILNELCREIYEDDDDYGFVGVRLGVLLLSTVKIHDYVTNETKYLSNHANYQNLIDKATKIDLDETQKMYIFEACNSAIAGNNLAATVLLGCSAELMLINLCQAYENYLISIGQNHEKFHSKVTNARNASTRVDEFYKRLESDEHMEVFKEQYDIENMKIQFNFLDIVRQLRNEVGHPTGNRISNEDLSTHFGNYQHLIEKLNRFVNDYKENPKF
ncbi:hypothetical protein [Bacillus wiedmannii]|uniref:hypothetical protein n=1 Tax=Bacillus wiedmannii TaxID=1890302 RepID=UPI003D244C7C